MFHIVTSTSATLSIGTIHASLCWTAPPARFAIQQDLQWEVRLGVRPLQREMVQLVFYDTAARRADSMSDADQSSLYFSTNITSLITSPQGFNGFVMFPIETTKVWGQQVRLIYDFSY